MSTTEPIVINLGVFLPDRDDLSRLVFEFNLDIVTVIDLKCQIAKVLEVPKEELLLLHAGSTLYDADELRSIGIKNGTFIQVVRINKPLAKNNITIEDIKKAVTYYKRIYLYIGGGTYTKLIRPELIKQILIKYPEFNNNLGAFAILKDTSLLDELQDLGTASRVAKQYPLLITCADYIAKTLKEIIREHNKSTVPTTRSPSLSDDSLSDSSVISENESNNTSEDIRRRISRTQLATALSLAGTSSVNSLANIAQRINTPATTDAAASSSSSSSLTMNSITNTELVTGGAAGVVSDSAPTTSMDAQIDNNSSEVVPSTTTSMQERFRTQLNTMHEMGLFDDVLNMQSLNACNGDVVAAVNLVLTNLNILT